MKTFILIITIYIFCSLNSLASVSYSTEGFLKYKTCPPEKIPFSLNSFSEINLKQRLQSNPESILNVMETIVLISGTIYLYKYYDNDVSSQSYKDRGLILTAIGIGGFILQIVDTPRYSGNHNYGPRGALNHKAGFQLCMNGTGLGLKFSF